MESSRLKREQVPHFLRAIRHNQMTISRQIESGRFCDADFFFVTCANGEYELMPPVSQGGRRDAELARSFNDYMAGALVGAIPYAARHGADGIKVSETGEVTQVELKLCMRSEDSYTISDNGFVTTPGTKKSVSITSDCSACYEIRYNLASKNVDTYFVFYDSKRHELVGVWLVPGAAIVTKLSPLIPREGEKAKKLSISLAFMIREGQEVFLDFIDSVGLETWERRIYDRCGRDPSEATRGCWTRELNEQFSKLWTTGVSVQDIMAEFPDKTADAIRSHASKLKLRRPANNN